MAPTRKNSNQMELPRLLNRHSRPLSRQDNFLLGLLLPSRDGEGPIACVDPLLSGADFSFKAGDRREDISTLLCARPRVGLPRWINVDCQEADEVSNSGSQVGGIGRSARPAQKTPREPCQFLRTVTRRGRNQATRPYKP